MLKQYLLLRVYPMRSERSVMLFKRLLNEKYNHTVVATYDPKTLSYWVEGIDDLKMLELQPYEVENFPEFWQLIKQPEIRPVLFTTIDGKDIREGDKVYFWAGSQFNHKSPGSFIARDVEYNTVLLFSTKEAALLYRLTNIKLLSIEDIHQLSSGNISPQFMDRVKNLVNDRIEEKYSK